MFRFSATNISVQIKLIREKFAIDLNTVQSNLSRRKRRENILKGVSAKVRVTFVHVANFPYSRHIQISKQTYPNGIIILMKKKEEYLFYSLFRQ